MSRIDLLMQHLSISRAEESLNCLSLCRIYMTFVSCEEVLKEHPVKKKKKHDRAMIFKKNMVLLDTYALIVVSLNYIIC